MKAEATSFLPTALKRKRAQQSTESKSGLNTVNAAAGASVDEVEERVSLASKFPKRDQGMEEYMKFKEGVEDLL